MMNVPNGIEPGLPLASAVLEKIRDILLYLRQTRLIEGEGIRLLETPGGILIRSEDTRKSASALPPRKAEGFPEYAGPWGLYLYMDEYIKARSGLMWTPEGTIAKTATPCEVPEENSFIVLDADGVLSTIPDPHEYSVPYFTDAHYWDTHAILGKYEADSQKVTQYHFSPIVYMIQTEELVIPIIS